MEMKFLRTILNKIKKDEIRNTNIRLELGMGEHKNGIRKRRLKWYGYVMRMGEDKIPNKTLHTKNAGKRLRGRPRIRWIDRFIKDIEIK
jgi:hypothetical protein